MGLFGPTPDKYDDMSYEDMMSKYNKYKDNDPQQSNYWLGHANRVGPGGFAPVVDTTGDWRVVENSDPYAGMMERIMGAMQERMMGEQMAMQERFNAQQMALQQQQMDLAREQMAMQEQATQFANQESSKTPSDYVQVNAADTKRKQLLRRGLMSTFTRYPSSASGGAAKAEKLGG